MVFSVGAMYNAYSTVQFYFSVNSSTQLGNTEGSCSGVVPLDFFFTIIGNFQMAFAMDRSMILHFHPHCPCHPTHCPSFHFHPLLSQLTSPPTLPLNPIHNPSLIPSSLPTPTPTSLKPQRNPFPEPFITRSPPPPPKKKKKKKTNKKQANKQQ